MPKPKNTGASGRKGGKSAADCGNVTVYDYAHVKGQANVSERERKAQRNPHHQATREFAVCPSDTLEALDWDERSLESFDAEIDTLISNGDTETDKTRITPRKTKSFHCPGTGSTSYPLDLWFLVARYISPEDIGRFAGICRATHLVTHTAHFWVQLYHRIHSRHRSDLPTDLQPFALERVHGLRARVIRSIHYAYPPFLSRTGNATQFSDRLCEIEGTKCISSWYVKKTRRLWHLFFKFKRVETPCVLARCTTDDQKSLEGYQLLRGFADLHHNQNEGCYILRVAASDYNPSLQTAMGLYLVSVGVSASRCMRHHKLQLVMDPRPYVRTRGDDAESKVVCIDPAIGAKLFAWWQKDFPENA